MKTTRIKVNKKRETIILFFQNAVKIVIYCKSQMVKKFVNGKLWNTFFIDDCDPDAIPGYIKHLTNYSHSDRN